MTSAGDGATELAEKGEEAMADEAEEEEEETASCRHLCLQGVQTSSWSLHTLQTTSGST